MKNKALSLVFLMLFALGCAEEDCDSGAYITGNDLSLHVDPRDATFALLRASTRLSSEGACDLICHVNDGRGRRSHLVTDRRRNPSPEHYYVYQLRWDRLPIGGSVDCSFISTDGEHVFDREHLQVAID